MRIGSDFGVVLESLVSYSSLKLVILEVIVLFSLGITELMKDHEHMVIKWYYWRKILCFCGCKCPLREDIQRWTNLVHLLAHHTEDASGTFSTALSRLIGFDF